jgi:regulatory protein
MSFAQPSLKGRALRLLSSREHSRAELERKLRSFEQEPGTLAQALDELQAKGFISEQRVLESVIHRRAARLGTARIRQELQGKGLAPQLVLDAVATLQATEEARACEVWRKKFGTPATDAAAKYSPNQPRVPAGNSDGGQWTNDGAGAASAQVASSSVRQAQEILPFFARPPVIVRPPLIRPPPPFEEYPTEPAKPPGPGWEWKGENPTPGSREGNWYKPETRESLHPEMDHKPPIGPHWDYRAPDGNWYRWFPDGRMEPKRTIPPVPATPVPGTKDELRA